jgi:hypothetical protein
MIRDILSAVGFAHERLNWRRALQHFDEFHTGAEACIVKQ